MLVPIFELAEGRCVVRAGEQIGVHVVGLQHGAIGLAHRWRVVLPQGLMKRFGGQDYQPDVIAVEGPISRDWLLEAGLMSERIKVVGAPRVIHEIPDANHDQLEKTILVLGEYHQPQVLFDWCTRHVLDLGFQVVLRPHPTHYGKAETWFDQLGRQEKDQIRMSLPGESLSENLLQMRPFCILASVTGAMVEVALSGWPLGVILSNWLPDYAPLTAVPEKSVFSSNDPVEVREWLARLWRDSVYRETYGQSCRQVAQLHIAMTGDDAAAELASCLL